MSETGIIQTEQGNISIQIPTQTALNVWQDKEAFDQVARVANMLSKSTIVPQNYQGKPEDCFIAVEMASRMNTSPIFIMQNLYVVKGKPSWAGQACMAMISSCGKFRNVKHVYTGTRGTEDRGCYVTAQRISDGETLQGTEVTVKMAKDEGWYGSNSKWRNMTEQMLGYRAASFFARMFCPEAMMGLQTTEEIYDVQPVVMTPSAQDLSQAILNEEEQPKKTAKKSAEKKAEEPEKIVDKQDPEFICADCGKEIVKSGKYSAEAIAKGSMEKYGRPLCMECGKKAKAEAERIAYQKAVEEQKKDDTQDDLAAQLMADAE